MTMDRQVDIPFAVPTAEKSDLERLTEYMGGPFRRRLSELARTQAEPIVYKGDCAEILRKSNFFHTELVGWLGLAKRLYTENYAEHLAVTQSAAGQQLIEQKRGLRPTAGMIEAHARQELAPLEDAIERMEQTVRLCDKLASSAQSMLRTMSQDEFTGRAEGGEAAGQDAWDDFSEAPITNALERLGVLPNPQRS
jgi:hypothetical protein